MTTKRTVSIDEIYSQGRRFPRGQTRDVGARESIAREPKFETSNSRNRVHNSNENQDPEDKYDAGYLNDCSGWLRGARGVPTCENETAENYPQGNFDKGQSYRRPDKGNDWGSGSDHREPFVKPERITVNAKQRRND
jgi:hypothetical protein